MASAWSYNFDSPPSFTCPASRRWKIGGSILSTLLQQGYTTKYPTSVLVRGRDKADALSNLGVKAILFDSLDQLDRLQQVASEHDTAGAHTNSARALILGLAERKKQTGKEVHYIHTSGTSNLADQPITGAYHEDRIFSDKDDIYQYLKDREALQVYPQRTTDITVVETGLQVGVKTTILMSPTIYGIGTGLFNTVSIQGPLLTKAALKSGQADVIGEGKGIWDYVHILDLANLYEIVLSRVLAGKEVPTGEKGILFTSTGRFSWAEFSTGIAKALFSLGAIKTPDVKNIGIEEATEKLFPGNPLVVELSLASNSRTSSDIAYGWGWKPLRTAQDFEQSYLEEAKAVVDKVAASKD
ncbi:hypothetical protein B7494_g7299 [Chlorociboria aeruginascens]|nr:hypothetical protein B7494_g7299 [Chlorociboria aeruginascens]